MTGSFSRAAAMLGAAAVMLQPVAAAAQEKPCITEGEVGALVIFLAPSLIHAVRERCEGQLAGDGFLAREGDAFAARYAALRDTAWPEAKAGFVKFADSDTKRDREEAQAMASMPDETLQPMIEAVIAKEASDNINVRDCARVERMLAALAPIEPRVAANVIGVVLGLTGIKDPAICPVEQT